MGQRRHRCAVQLHDRTRSRLHRTRTRRPRIHTRFGCDSGCLRTAVRIDRFDAIRERLLETMPDFVRRNIRGTTDSEYLFHALLSFLHDSGHLASKETQDQSVLSAIRSTVTLIDRFSREVGADPAVLNLVLTNGRSMYALRRGAPLMIAERDRLPAARESQPTAAAEKVRYVLIASGEAAGAPGFDAIRADTVIGVDSELRVATHSLV